MNLLQRLRTSAFYRTRYAWHSALLQRYRFPGGYRRIYFYHIRKTGGTSLNHMFLGLAGEDGKALYQRMGEKHQRLVHNGKIYVGWKQRLIEEGRYFYAFSHIPAHELTLPPHTYTFTCLRDPVKRVISHYRMLLDHQASSNPHPSFEVEKQWLGADLLATVQQMPPEHRFFQLYMFSPTFDVQEGLAGLQACNQVVFTETLEDGVQQLNRDLNITLQYRHSRKSQHTYHPTEAELAALRELMEPEYELIRAWEQVVQSAR